MTNYLDLTGKVALITGGSSGIGAATAQVFTELGAKVAIGYHRNREGADKVAAETGALAIHSDVRDESGVRALVDATVAKYGPIDILINNAGSLVERMKLRDINTAQWDNIFRLNVSSAVWASQAVVQSMIDRKAGAIVNIVSIAGRNGGGPGATAYASAKAALIAFTKGSARELAPQGIRVNAVSPGVIDTPFHEVFSTPEMIKGFVAGIPMGRTGTSIECAKAIAFLASDAASYIVGETLEVNGGQLML
jgi:3-oxoacyl-[acyl-carrier protein] reductase